MASNHGEWYAVVGFGSGPMPQKGPWRSVDTARGAIQRFRERYGWEAGTHLAAGSVRIVGPYDSRQAALNAGVDSRRIVEGT